MTEVLILAGGMGTRLAGVVKDVPKPMAPIAGRPFLEFQIEYFKHQGFSKFTLLTGHLAEVIEKHFGDGKHFGVDIRYSRETTPLGTGGAIRQAMEVGKVERALVVNGDSFFATDYRRLVELSRGPATLGLKFSTDLSRYGTVAIDRKFHITGFAEKSSAARDGYINAGTYVIEHALLKHLPAGKSSLEKDVFEKLPTELLGIPCGGPFIDIGTPESFKEAATLLPEWLHREPKPCLFLDRDGVIVEHVNYLHKSEDVRIVPETVDLIHAAKANGWRVAVVSNQSGVGRGVFPQSDCDTVNTHIQRLLAAKGAGVDRWNCCFEHPTEAKGEYRRASLRRKPGPGMVLETCEAFAIDLRNSLMIGDNSTDQLELPDFKTLLVKGDYELRPYPDTVTAANFAQMRVFGFELLTRRTLPNRLS